MATSWFLTVLPPTSHRVILLDCPLEYKKGENSINVELKDASNFELLLKLEEEYVKGLCDDPAPAWRFHFFGHIPKIFPMGVVLQEAFCSVSITARFCYFAHLAKKKKLLKTSLPHPREVLDELFFPVGEGGLATGHCFLTAAGGNPCQRIFPLGSSSNSSGC